MNAKPEILFLAHRIPFPPDKGDKIRSWRLLQHLAQQHRVHLACFVDDPADMVHAPRLRALCETAAFVPLNRMGSLLRGAHATMNNTPLTVGVYRDASMKQIVDALRARPLVAEIVFSSTMAQYIETPVAGRPRIIDFCDADSEKFDDYASTAASPLRRLFAREGRLLRVAENAIVNWADASFAITPDEAERFNARADVMRHVGWWSNGVDTDYFDPDAVLPATHATADIAFTGAMDYRANIDAVAWFVKDVWPLVRDKTPDATFAIVGAKPARAVRELATAPGIRVTGRVDDIRPWIAGAKLAIAPLRIARGIQNKVLEAMAMTTPVIATGAAATGIRAAAGEEIVIADTPDAFAAATLTLLNDTDRCAKIGAAARARMVADYQWNRQLSRFSAALDAALSSDGASKSSAA